ncbi:hypothetical protein AA313_de0200530 [Arthrobotrys entomopaga]|nr:hypothetical protein AA313_de0200530 [Arthrobotrys entomopaga]
MAEIAGVILGLPGLAQVCIELCVLIRSRIKDCDSNHLNKMNKTIVSLLGGEIHTLLEYFASRGETLSPGLIAEMEIIYQILRNLLEKANRVITQNPAGTLSSFKFALFQKQKIDEVIKELEEWQLRFMRRALVVLFFGDQMPLPRVITNNVISGQADKTRPQIVLTSETPSTIERIGVSRVWSRQEISESQLVSTFDNITQNFQASIRQRHGRLSLAQDALCSSNNTPRVPNSTVTKAICGWLDGGQPTPILVDFRVYPENATEAAVEKIRKLIRDVAAVFAMADPKDTSILTSVGFAHDPLNSRFELHFKFPSVTMDQPRSLLDMLLDAVNKKQGVFHHLNQRISLAKQLASALLYVHSFGFVHKNIRPDNVLVFEPSQSSDGSDVRLGQFPRYLGKPFLVGFNGIRKVDAESQMLSQSDPKCMIYHHPDRYRLKEGHEFTMKHDIYSLGVVLLEIALWNSFYDRGPGALGSKLWADAHHLHPPDKLNSIFVRLASTQVPRIVGERYRDAVLACLTGLKDENGDTIMKDEDGIELGLAYLQQVVELLEEICL